MKKFLQTLYSDGSYYRGHLAIVLTIAGILSPYLLKIFGLSFPKYEEIVGEIIQMPYGWLCLPFFIWVFFAYLKRYGEYKKITDRTSPKIHMPDVIQMLEKKGRDLSNDNDLYVVFRELRQAAYEGELEISGVFQEFSSTHEVIEQLLDPVLTSIPAKEWEKLRIRVCSSGTNYEQGREIRKFDCGAYKHIPQGKEFVYKNLHVSSAGLDGWLKRANDRQE